MDTTPKKLYNALQATQAPFGYYPLFAVREPRHASPDKPRTPLTATP